jgi:hypothetical protein
MLRCLPLIGAPPTGRTPTGPNASRPSHDAVAYYRRLADAGLDYFIAGVYGNDTETVRLLAERVVPALGESQSGAAGSAG